MKLLSMAISALSFIVLGACGGGTDEPTRAVDQPALGSGPQPPIVTRLKTAPTAMLSSDPENAPFILFNSTDEVGFSFDIYSSQIQDIDVDFKPGASTTLIRRAYINVDSDNEVTLVTPGGNVFEFVRAETTIVTPNRSEYRFVEKDGGTNTLILNRIKNGTNYGFFKITDPGNVSGLRASFTTGWRTEPGTISAATATYSSRGPSDIFFSNGHRIFDGQTDLFADFSAGKITGTLFNNAHGPQEGIVVDVQLNDGTINADNTISENDSISMRMTDQFDPLLSQVVSDSSTLDGLFTGSAATGVSGHYGGSISLATTKHGAHKLDYSGTFWAINQDPALNKGSVIAQAPSTP